MKKITYKTSGVDINKANIFVNSIKGLSKSTRSSAVLNRKGSFGSLFRLPEGQHKNPVLVSSSDGVGTKLLIAKLANKHDTVGIDLVGMNVNDILCTGAKPLFFLDYIACGKLKPAVLKKVIGGIARGCKDSGCALVGGETAEMPGMYKKDDYDLAGFAVGIVEESKIIDGSRIKKGDRLIGLASSGLHSNGFSLVRKVLSTKEQKKISTELLKPTKIYVKPVLRLIKEFNVKGMAHITGGAFYDKLTKIIPQGKCCRISKASWPVPKIFQTIQKKGRIPAKEMYRTFNMGIGMVIVAGKKDAASVIKSLKRKNIKSWEIGEIIDNRKEKIIL